MSGGRLLVYAQDAGGALAICPIIDRLMSDGDYSVKVVTHSSASDLYRKLKIDHDTLESLAEKIPLNSTSACDLLRKLGPVKIISTTSNNRYDPSNGELIRAALTMGIPCFAFFDHWKGWKKLSSSDDPMRYFPGVLGVIDHRSVEYGVSLGFPRQRMIAVGHPRLEALYDWQGANRKEIRKLMGVDDEIVCTFFSQPLVRETEENTRFESLFGSELESFIFSAFDIFQDIFRQKGFDVRFCVRMHRKEVFEGGFNFKSRDIKIPDTKISSLDLALGSNLVIGLDSMILYEAFFCGIPVVSLKYEKFSAIDENFQGWPEIIPAVQNEEELSDYFKRHENSIVLGRSDRFEEYPLIRDSIKQCVEMILGDLSISLETKDSVL